MLFSWYYKGFELLWRFFIKHPTGVKLEELDLEAVDKEMATDEAAQMSQAVQDTVIAPKGSTPDPAEANEQEASV